MIYNIMNIYMPGRTTRSSYRSPVSTRRTVIPPDAPRRRRDAGRRRDPRDGVSNEHDDGERVPLRRRDGNPALDLIDDEELSLIQRRYSNLPGTNRRLFNPNSPRNVADIWKNFGSKRKSRRKRRKSRRKRRKSRRKSKRRRRKSRRRRRRR